MGLEAILGLVTLVTYISSREFFWGIEPALVVGLCVEGKWGSLRCFLLCLPQETALFYPRFEGFCRSFLAWVCGCLATAMFFAHKAGRRGGGRLRAPVGCWVGCGWRPTGKKKPPRGAAAWQWSRSNKLGLWFLCGKGVRFEAQHFFTCPFVYAHQLQLQWLDLIASEHFCDWAG